MDRYEYEAAYKEFFSEELWSFVSDFLAITNTLDDSRRYFFAGNGASASIASHLATDFCKALNRRGETFHDPAFMTCFSNDYGYDHWLSEAVKLKADEGDVLVLISSSGRSPNILEAARSAKSKGLLLITLTGPSPEELLKEYAVCHLSVNSEVYNIIECCHMIALCAVVDSVKTMRLSNL
jgi:D-sedoheptulose 7-phosphate isomerase